MKGIKQYRRHKENGLPSHAYRKFEHNFVFSFQDVKEIYLEEFKPLRLSFWPDPPDDEIFEMVVNGKTYQKWLADEKSDTFITQGELTKEIYNSTIHEVKDRTLLYIGDEAGFIKLWDLDLAIERTGIKPVKAFRDMKVQYNPYRMEKVDCSELASSIRKNKRKPLPDLHNPAMLSI